MAKYSKIAIILALSIIVFFIEGIEEIIFSIKDKRILFFFFLIVIIPTGILFHKLVKRIDRKFLIGKCYNCNKNLLSYSKVLNNLECLNCNKINQTNFLLISANFILLFISIIFWKEYIFSSIPILNNHLTFSYIPVGILFFYMSGNIKHLKPK